MIKQSTDQQSPKIFLRYSGRNSNIPFKNHVRQLEIPSNIETEVMEGASLLLKNVYSSPILGNVSFSLETGRVFNQKEELNGEFSAHKILKRDNYEWYVTGYLSLYLTSFYRNVKSYMEELTPMDEFFLMLIFEGKGYEGVIEIIEETIKQRNDDSEDL